MTLQRTPKNDTNSMAVNFTICMQNVNEVSSRKEGAATPRNAAELAPTVPVPSAVLQTHGETEVKTKKKWCCCIM